jgi:hypothetical protein
MTQQGEINPDDGYEWLEYPEGSEKWFTRSSKGEAWKPWEQ